MRDRSNQRKNRLITSGKYDYLIFVIILILVFIGIIMVFSAGQYDAQETYDDSFYYLKKQLTYAIAGIVVMLIISKINYKLYAKIATLALVVSIGLVLAVKFFGSSGGGAERWLIVAGIRFQPSEILKLSLVLFLASNLANKEKKLKQFFSGFLPYLIIAGLCCGLIAGQDLGSAITLFLVCMIMFVCAGVPGKFILILVPFAIVAAVALIVAEPHRMERITSFLHPWDDPEDTGFQVTRSFLAIGSGGLFGVGLGNGGSKFYLPERHTDFIFAALAEETGLIGVLFVLILFAVFTWRGFNIGLKMKDNFGKLLAIGLTSMISVQAIINICVVIGFMPVTGITLPFISYGGTSLMISLASVGILLNISRYVKFAK